VKVAHNRALRDILENQPMSERPSTSSDGSLSLSLFSGISMATQPLGAIGRPQPARTRVWAALRTACHSERKVALGENPSPVDAKSQIGFGVAKSTTRSPL